MFTKIQRNKQFLIFLINIRSGKKPDISPGTNPEEAGLIKMDM
jgi:hypothetical protein